MRLIYLLIFIAILLQSCQYEPTGTNYVKIDPNFEPAYINISLPNDEDTLWLPTNKVNNIRYTISGEINRLNIVTIFWDTLKIISTSNKPSNNFSLPEISTQAIEFHTLDIIASTKSGTNSFADLIGIEGLLYHKHYVLAFVGTDYFKYDSLKFEEVDGLLSIKWNKYLFNDFKNYRVEKKIAGSSYFQVVGSPDQYQAESFYDKTYTGEPAEYRVLAVNNYDNFKFLTSGYKNAELPKISIRKISRDVSEVNWTMPKYSGNIQKYVINVSKDYKPVDINNVNTLSYKVNTSLGEEYPSSFIIYSKEHTKQSYYDLYTTKFNFINGDSSFKFSTMKSETDNYIYYIDNIDKTLLIQYDIRKNVIVNTVKLSTYNVFTYVLSPNGKYILYAKDNDFVLSKSDEFPNGKIISRSFLQEPNSRFESVAISDNGICVLSSKSQRMYVCDLINQRIIKILDGIFKVAISKGGKYFVATNLAYNPSQSSLYSIEQNDVKLLKVNLKLKFFKFSPKDDNILLYVESTDNSLKFYNFNTDNIEKAYSLTGLTIHTIDFESGYLIVYNSKDIQILDLENNFLLIDSFKMNNAEYELHFKSGTCYCGKGMKWEIGK